uniref:Uncharacterized protein n=1 Tax=Arundo donax TaxID=35708 RepID=A0A0A8YDA5_ARUDO
MTLCSSIQSVTVIQNVINQHHSQTIAGQE